MTPDTGHLELIMAVLALLIVVGVCIEVFRKRVIQPRRETYYRTVERPRQSLAESRAWGKRLQQLHVIDDDGGSRLVRVIKR